MGTDSSRFSGFLLLETGGFLMKKRIIYLLLPIVTLILEILPYGAVCNFADGPGNTIRKTFSYFSLVPFGYANFTPLITAIITCIMFTLLIIYVITNKQVFVIKAKNILYVCILFSLGQFIFGLSYFSIVSGLITITLVGELLLLIFTLKTNV